VIKTVVDARGKPEEKARQKINMLLKEVQWTDLQVNTKPSEVGSFIKKPVDGKIQLLELPVWMRVVPDTGYKFADTSSMNTTATSRGPNR